MCIDSPCGVIDSDERNAHVKVSNAIIDQGNCMTRKPKQVTGRHRQRMRTRLQRVLPTSRQPHRLHLRSLRASRRVATAMGVSKLHMNTRPVWAAVGLGLHLVVPGCSGDKRSDGAM